MSQTPPRIDAVLQAPPPRFTTGEARRRSRPATFGITAGGARNLGSERDQTFMLLDDAGARRWR